MKYKPTLKPPEFSSHSRQLLQRTRQIQWMWTALPNVARIAAIKGRNGKVMTRTASKEATVLRQSPNPNKNVICWSDFPRQEGRYPQNSDQWKQSSQ